MSDIDDVSYNLEKLEINVSELQETLDKRLAALIDAIDKNTDELRSIVMAIERIDR